MKYLIILWLAFMLTFFALHSAHAAGGAGGSWGDDSGFGGNGGGFGGSGSGGDWGQSCSANIKYSGIPNTPYSSPSAACASLVGKRVSNYVFTAGSYAGGDMCSYSVKFDSGKDADFSPASMLQVSGCLDKPECPAGEVIINGVCTKELKCPAGYVESGSTCIWQCPAGYKMLGGNCVKDDMPEDCDPAIQECDEDGKPVCDCCASLTQLVNQNNTMINNDNRIISLTETTVSNQNTIINNTENINNNISTVNNNITTTNNKLDQLIQTINENKPDFDTSALEAKLDQLIAKEVTVGDVTIDLDKTNALLEQIDASVKANKYDDTELKAKLDELINKDLSEVTMRQDEQTGLLEQIRDLLRPVKEGELAPSLEDVAFEARLDPWSAIRGFDVNQNMINARAQCPAGDAYSFNFFGHHFAMPMSILCGYLAQLGVGFMFLAYMGGAFIIVKGD